MKDNKGFTLIEVLITMIVSTIIIGAIVAYSGIGVSSFRTAETETLVKKENQIVVNSMLNKFRAVKKYRTITGSDREVIDIITGTVDESKIYHNTNYCYIILNDGGVYLYKLGDSDGENFLSSEDELLNKDLSKNNLLSNNSFKIKINELNNNIISIDVTNKVADQSEWQNFTVKTRNEYTRGE